MISKTRKLLILIATAIAMLGVTASAQAGEGGSFNSVCDSSHLANDDPIVFPKQPGVSHLHEFAGNRNTSASLGVNPQSLRWHPETTCVRDDELRLPTSQRSNSSAMWIPAAFDNGSQVRFSRLSPIYDSGVNRDFPAIKPFPFGLKIIAGSAAGGPNQINGHRVWDFYCTNGTISSGTSTVAPSCANKSLRMVIKFPDCWDGINLDSANHKSHMTYSYQSKCPATHPVLMPQLKFVVDYPTDGGADFSLASGPINTAHADYIPAWREGKLEQLTRDCLNVDRYCGGQSSPVQF